MGSDGSAGLLEYIRFDGVESGKVRLACRDLGNGRPRFAWLRQGISALWQGSRRFPVSQIEAVLAEVMHKGGAFP